LIGISIVQRQTSQFSGAIYLHGGKTWAASPHSKTRSLLQTLQLRAAKKNGRARRIVMQSSGYDTSSASLSILHSAEFSHAKLAVHLPVATTRMREVRKYYALDVIWRGHFCAVFSFLDYIFESPQSILWLTKMTAYSWPSWIAKKAEFFWKEQAVDLLRCKAFLP
jgi:hypothetical protein